MSRVNIISQRHALCFSMVVICIWLLFPLSALAKVEKRSGDHSSVVLAYLYNFGKFVSWPKELTSPQTSPIIYCFYGSLASSESIHFLENKTLRGRPIQVLAKAISDSTMECDLVYIDNYGLDKVHVDYLINLSPVRHQLTVSSADNFMNAGCEATRTPRVYPWMNEPSVCILMLWKSIFQVMEYLNSNTTLFGLPNTGGRF